VAINQGTLNPTEKALPRAANLIRLGRRHRQRRLECLDLGGGHRGRVGGREARRDLLGGAERLVELPQGVDL
jgi:hypothetical protein